MYPQITILGCGLSGMITALCYASKGINTIIIEANFSKHKLFFNDPRATALTSNSKKIFEEIGIWNELKKLVGPINDIYVADNRGPFMLHFSSQELPKNEIMGYLIENTKFKKLLFNLVTANKYIKTIEETSYDIIDNSYQGCKLLLSNNRIHTCDLLIVADGRASRAKQNFFSPKIEKIYEQCSITFITKHQKPHEGTAVEHFMPSGPFAILPLKSQYNSSIVWTIKKEASKAIMNLPKNEFTYLVQQNFGNFLGNIKVKGVPAVFPLKAYITKKYYNKSIVLIADSAHIIHPLAGQGLNQGIKDIKSLATMTIQYKDKEALLAQYQKLRLADNANMLIITDTLNRTFSNNSKLFHCSRQLGFKAIESFPPFKKILIKYAMGNR